MRNKKAVRLESLFNAVGKISDLNLWTAKPSLEGIVGNVELLRLYKMNKEAQKIQTLVLFVTLHTFLLNSELHWTRQTSSPIKVTEDHICRGVFLSPGRRSPHHLTPYPAQPPAALAMLQVVLGAPQRLLKEGRQSRKLVLVVVFVALLLDNMLLTVVGTFGALSAEGYLLCVTAGSMCAGRFHRRAETC